jgi:hypothetical protein
MKRFLFIIFYCTATFFASAQDSQPIVNSTIDRFNGTGGIGVSKINAQTMMYGYDNTEIRVKGNGYLDTLWHKGNIVFYPETGKVSKDNPLTLAENLTIRWDIHRNEIDVMINNKILATAGSTVYEFSYLEPNGKRRIFRNTAAIVKNDDKTLGFYEVLADGKAMFLRKYETQVKNPTFNAALNVGDKDYYFQRVEGFYAEKADIIEKLKSKTSFFTEGLMKNKAKNIELFIKENNLNLKKEEDLIKLFSYYNTL